MAENNNFINVGGRLHSIATGNVLAGTDEIYDDGKGKKQSTINAETDAILAQHTSVIQGLNSQNYETYAATNQTTAVTDVLPAIGSVNTIYRLGNWDGSQFDPSCYTEYSWNGTQYVPISTKTQIDEVFDISAYHASGGILTTYTDLSAALDSNNGGGVPQSLQRGGMSIKFVCSSDNKYVQYRYMGTKTTGNPNPFFDESNWQGIEDELIYQSKNIITSGAVEDVVLNIKDAIGKEETFTYDSKQYSDMILVVSEGYPKTPTSGYDGIIIPIVAGNNYVITTSVYSISTFSSYPIKNDSTNVVRTDLRRNVPFTAGETEKYLLVSLRLSESQIVSITRKETGVYKRLSKDELRLNNNETDIDEINDRLGYSAETLNLTSSDAANMFWNGSSFQSQTGDNHNCLVVRCIKGVIYRSTSLKLSFYIFDYKPYVGATSQPITYKNAIFMPYTAEYDGWMVFQFQTRESISLNLSYSNSGVFELIQGLTSQNAANSEKIVQLNNDVNNIDTKIGENIQTISFPADVKDIFWNGTSFYPNTSSTDVKAIVFKCIKGVTFTWTPGRRHHIYIFDYKPYVNATKQPIIISQAVEPPYTPDMNGWVVIQENITTTQPFELSIDNYGLIKDTEELNSNLILAKSITRLQEFSLGNRLINKAKTFSWKAFNKPIISIRADDLNVETDLIVKIVTDAGLPIMLAAPPNINAIPTGITNQEDRIGETMGEVCQYVVAHGGEILEHSYATFTSSDYETSIKPFFIDSKAAFMKLGINIRGAAVANSNPSDSLRDYLAPYLYYYYDFSNGYGKNAPYNMDTWDSTNDAGIYTLESFQQKVDSTIAQNKHWTFILHHIGGSSNISEEVFRQMVNYVKEKKEQGIVDVLTWSNVYDTYSQFE